MNPSRPLAPSLAFEQADLDAFIARAQAGRWGSLAVLGPGVARSYCSYLVRNGWDPAVILVLASGDLRLGALWSVGLTHLRCLDLGGNQVGDDGARAIASGLGHLTTLDLRGNQVGDDGARAIASGLGHLTTLDLGANQVGDDGARTIASGLSQLTSLGLFGNEVGADGARAIASGLSQLY